MIYAMFSSELPFDSKDRREIKKLTISGELKFSKPSWERVSQ
jgi:hypothetical protein